MKVLLSLVLASAVSLTAAPAFAGLCLKKPSVAELQSTTLDQVRKTRDGQRVFLDDISIPEKECKMTKNTWTAVTPIGQFRCKATDQMERPSCTPVVVEPKQQASIASR